jgi:thioredoxin 1
MKLKIFSAAWCQPCQQLKKVLKENDIGIPVLTIDVDSYKELCIESNVRSVPTLILEKDGVEIKRTTGAKTLEQLTEFITT